MRSLIMVLVLGALSTPAFAEDQSELSIEDVEWRLGGALGLAVNNESGAAAGPYFATSLSAGVPVASDVEMVTKLSLQGDYVFKGSTLGTIAFKASFTDRFSLDALAAVGWDWYPHRSYGAFAGGGLGVTRMGERRMNWELNFLAVGTSMGRIELRPSLGLTGRLNKSRGFVDKSATND